MSAEQKPFVEGGVIDGKAVAAAIREEIAATVRLLKEKHGKVTLSSSPQPHPAITTTSCCFLSGQDCHQRAYEIRDV